MDDKLSRYLDPTAVIDCGHAAVEAKAREVAGRPPDDPVATAVRLYQAVRDGIWYDPYLPFYRAEHYRASRVLEQGRAFCIGKAGLLCALSRACGIPARLAFADVRNHLATRQLIEFMGSDVFVFHGVTEFFLEGRWVKATPAFNAALCRRHGVAPLDFNGREDSLFQSFNSQGRQFMEYVRERGSFDDIPVEQIVAAWREAYGVERVDRWIERFEASGGAPVRDFSSEDPLSSTPCAG
ncbi:MAG: transglutaminase-like domain-containing protein [Desulfobacterales bacterium]|jgi:transglutaminase-like putative cysteine protease|nr:transglutaminase-like domain-containing protein [Desulfobacterales bacterium]